MHLRYKNTSQNVKILLDPLTLYLNLAFHWINNTILAQRKALEVCKGVYTFRPESESHEYKYKEQMHVTAPSYTSFHIASQNERSDTSYMLQQYNTAFSPKIYIAIPSAWDGER